ncbi:MULTISPECIES: response regulator transcription factor [unclassified Paraeggerthella]|uniref:response regulator transcription factor n=1 Tax=unclassified Paraeggerthella TaxID=2641972 RepID=UPI001CE46C7D|nr:response regulator transcription factor [Paraeggerthella sp. Marseille-Q4926]
MKILIVEDDRNLSNAIKRCLSSTYDVDQAFDGAEGYFFAKEGIYDLVVLDLMLPEMDGYSVLEKLRKNEVFTPVLILTAKGTIADKARGFRTGADDYLVKPFDKDELLLRIEAILRRTMGLYGSADLSFKQLIISPTNRTASIEGRPIELKGKQFDALEYLVSRQGQLISKSQLFDKVWGFLSDTSSNVVEVYVSAIRKQLKPFGYDAYLKTIRGVGYLLTDEDDHA